VREDQIIKHLKIKRIMKMTYLEPEIRIVELKTNKTLLIASGGTDVTEENYENIGDGGVPGAIAE
jgi:hypothetical protein